jgi:exopolyphosphatase/guanosine-5'-triphosphate,3'-diphosphate pyrophosphatase
MGLSAVIDLGTNTFRLFVAEVTERQIRSLYSENRITRLGEGFSQKKQFLPQAMERALQTLIAFRTTLDRYRTEQIYVVGTSAFRESENRDQLILAIREQVGFNVEVISGEEEARYTFLGANLILRPTGPMVLIDIGGGSTEFIIAGGEEERRFLSLPLGVIRLTENHLHADPSTPQEIKALKQEIKNQLLAVTTSLPQKAFFAGTAGTVTTLAAMDQAMAQYDPDKINGYPLPRKTVESILAKLLAISREERCCIPGLERGREDLIIPGLLIILVVMEQCGYDTLHVSDYGLREGVLLDRYQKETDG